jgi:zinc protease
VIRRATLRLQALGAFAAMLIAVSMAPQPAGATTVQRVVSPGGIEAWLVHEPSLPLVALNFAFVGGATADPADKPGVGHMVSSLLDDGAGELDAKAFQRRVEDNAVQLRFSVTQDYFSGSIRLLKDRQDPSFDLLRLALNQPRFDADAIGRVREQIMAGLRRETTDPGSIASKEWWRTAFPGHPYGRPTGGTLTSVPTITADDLRTYVKQVLTRDTLKVAAVGDIDAATLGKVLDTVFGSLPATGTRVTVPNALVRDGGRRIVVQLNVPQAVVRMGGEGLMRKDPDFIPAYVVNHILGGGSFTSRLYEEVREKRGLAYGVYSYLLTMRHAAMFMASTQTQAGSTREALELIEAQVARMVKDGPTEDELVKAKAYLKGSFALNFDTSTKIAGILLQNQLDDLGIDYIEKRDAMMDAVSIEDTRRAAKRLAEGGMLVTVVGQPKDLASKEPGG